MAAASSRLRRPRDHPRHGLPPPLARRSPSSRRLLPLAAASALASLLAWRLPSTGEPWLLAGRAGASRHAASPCTGRAGGCPCPCRAAPEAAVETESRPFEARLSELELLALGGKVEDCRALFDELRADAPEAKEHILWSVVLRAYANAGDFTGATTWYERLLEAGLAARPQALEALAKAATKAGETEEAVRWLRAMRDVPLGPDADGGDGELAESQAARLNINLAAAGLACVEACEPANLASLLSSAAQAGLSAADLGLADLVAGLCQEGDASGAGKLLLQMKQAGLTPSRVCFSMLIDAYSEAENEEAADFWAKAMEDTTGAALGRNDYNEAIRSCASRGDIDGAVKWFRAMEGAGLEADRFAYNVVISSFAGTADTSGASWWLAEMKRVGLSPGKTAYTTVIATCAEAGHAAAAMRWITEMRTAEIEPTPRCYNSIMRVCAKSGDTQGAVRWFEEMERAGHAPDKYSYTEVLQSFAKKGDSRGARRWLRAMIDAGLQPDAVSYNGVISAYARAGRSQDAEELIGEMKKSSVRPDVMTWSWAIIAYAKAKKRPRTYGGPELAFRKMVGSGLVPSNFTLRALDQAIGVVKRVKVCKELGVELGADPGNDIKCRPRKQKKQWRKPTGPYADGGREVKVISAGQAGTQMSEVDFLPDPYGEDLAPLSARKTAAKTKNRVSRWMGHW